MHPACRRTSARDGDGLSLRADPPRDGSFGGDARLDLVVLVPSSLAFEIADGRGDVTVGDVASLRLTGGSRSVRYEDVSGTVQVP